MRRPGNQGVQQKRDFLFACLRYPLASKLGRCISWQVNIFSLLSGLNIYLPLVANGPIRTANGIISPTSRPLVKRLFFSKKFLIFIKEFDIDIQNKKQKYLNRNWDSSICFQASDQNPSCTKCFSIFLRSSNLIFKKENEID